jgi:hypothetical protein
MCMVGTERRPQGGGEVGVVQTALSVDRSGETTGRCRKKVARGKVTSGRETGGFASTMSRRIGHNPSAPKLERLGRIWSLRDRVFGSTFIVVAE